MKKRKTNTSTTSIISFTMKEAKLVFIPSPGIGHLVSTIEFAKRLLDRDDRFSITVLVMKPPFALDIGTYSQSLAASDTRIRFISLPQVDPPPSLGLPKSPDKYVTDFIDNHKPHVKNTIINHVLANSTSGSVPLAGLVVDFFCTGMIDVAKELGVPSYLFFTSSAAFLGLMLYLPTRHDQVGTEFDESGPDSIIPSYLNPVPASVLPSVLFNKDGGYLSFQNHARRFKETNGIILNTFAELESHAVSSLLHDDIPSVYTVGSLLDLKSQSQLRSDTAQRNEIMKWLDDQPPSSVVFLCFGSLGSFDEAQLKEIAHGLEGSGQRFLWSIRKPPPKDKFEMPSDYMNHEEILPDGFLGRTKGQGMVCGWAPQVEVLAHKAVGGFISHCGWNSILESLWYGVPIVTWPIYAEQQINAFEMVKDLGLAVEMKLDYRMGGDLVRADEIVKVVKLVMNGDGEVRKMVKDTSEKSRKAVVEGGSSFAAFGCLIDDLLKNMS